MSQKELVRHINDAIGSHGAWKLHLRTAISTGRGEISSSIAGCDDQCAFGKWLYGSDIDYTTRAGVPYHVVKRLHAEFHRAAGSVLAYVERGNAGAAQTAMAGEFTERSEKLVRALAKWKREAENGVAPMPAASAPFLRKRAA